jgi:putative membrane protein
MKAFTPRLYPPREAATQCCCRHPGVPIAPTGPKFPVNSPFALLVQARRVSAHPVHYRFGLDAQRRSLMIHRFRRSIPALGAVLAVGLLGSASFAVAGDPGHDRHGWSNHDPGHGHWKKSCHGKRVSGLDERWLKAHIETNLFEIAGGEAARVKATSDEVRALAEHLVVDHTAALQEATALAQRLGIEVPTAPSPLQQWALRAVATFSGPDFDRWFADLQVEGHRQAIAEATTEVAKGCNRKVRGLAAAALPVLQEHLAHAEAALEPSHQR